ncbi:unnamed protein product [Urochloa humidicola]
MRSDSPAKDPLPATKAPARKKTPTGEHRRSIPFARRQTKTNLLRSSPETPSPPEKRRGAKSSPGKPEEELISRRSSTVVIAAPSNPSSAVDIAGEQPNYT